MEKLFFIFFLFPSIVSFAQSDTLISYSEVVNVNNSKNNLFINSSSWVEKTFIDSKKVLTISDANSGEISGNGILDFSIDYQGRKGTQVPVTVSYKFNIRVKDGKYKYEFTHFNVTKFWNTISNLGELRSTQGKDWFGTKKWSKIAYEETKEKVDVETKILILTLKDAMVQSSDF